MAYFKAIKSFEDLKEQFKTLAKANHPDAGGDAEIMKSINAEYDELFPVWKHRHNAKAAEPTTETADSTRSEFYTAYGWKGDKHDWNRTTKEVAACIRAYVKEIYPTYKFSVRFSSASMCSEIHIDLKEAPHGIYKEYDELTEDEIEKVRRKLVSNGLFNKNSWWPEELKAAVLEAWKESDFYRVYNDLTASVIADVDREVNSYNFNDSDSMIDYFHVDFYYFGVQIADGFRVVEKSARIKQEPEITAPASADQSGSEEYEIKEDVHTQTGARIWECTKAP